MGKGKKKKKLEEVSGEQHRDEVHGGGVERAQESGGRGGGSGRSELGGGGGRGGGAERSGGRGGGHDGGRGGGHDEGRGVGQRDGGRGGRHDGGREVGERGGGRGVGERDGGRGVGERGGVRGGGHDGGRGGAERGGGRGGGHDGGRGGAERGGGREGGADRGGRGGGADRGGRGGGAERGGGRGGAERGGGRGGAERGGGRGGAERGGGRGGAERGGGRGGGAERGGREGGAERGGGRGGAERGGGRGGGAERGGRGGGAERGGGRGGGAERGGERGGAERGGGRGGGAERGKGRGDAQRVGGGDGEVVGSAVTAVSPPAVSTASAVAPVSTTAPDDRTTADVEALRTRMEQSLKLERPRQFTLTLPKRSSVGTLGRPIKLISNHFDLRVGCRTVYHYDIELTPRASKAIKRQVFHLAMQQSAEIGSFLPVYDGEKNMYTARRLPLKEGSTARLTVLHTPMGETQREFTVSVKPAQPCAVDIDPLLEYARGGSSCDIPQQAVLALDIVMRHLPSMQFTPVGRSFFPEQGPRTLDIGGGCELWLGYYTSIRVGWKQPRIIIDASNKAFHKEQTVLDKMFAIVGQRFNPDRGLDTWQHKEVEKQLRNVKVEYKRGNTGGKRRYRVNGLSRRSARESMFDNEGRKMSVEDYFVSTLGVKLRYPLLPCLWVGSRTKHIYIPSEICTIVKGQPVATKLDADQVSSMIRETAVPADERLRRIRSYVGQANFNKDPHNQAFQLHVSDRPTEVNGRILPPPAIKYGSGSERPRDGVWRSQRFIDARALENWAVLDYASVRDDRLSAFVDAVYERGSGSGMKIEYPRGVERRDGRMPDRVDAVADLKALRDRFGPLQLVVVVLPAKNKLYGVVKHAGDVTVGQMTACVLSKNVMKADRNTALNICLKWNAKLGGTNNALEPVSRPKFLDRPTIVFGADVTHPAPDQYNKPSIAAVVASMDRSYHVRYSQRVLVQFPEQGSRALETIIDLKSAVKELLIEFYKFNKGTKPEKIVFFRDGVSEGQFEEVMARELGQLREACRLLESGYEPKITFLVVQKRHHTRLFAQDMRETVGRSKNVPPGTVVDSVICHPSELDYFLVSHQGIQGTSRPTHYHLLHDDSNFTADQLQLLTYYMCHLFARCTRSVSNPAPSYYAHHVAYRARMHHDNYLRLEQVPEDRAAPLQPSIKACQPTNNLLKEMYYV